MTSETIDRSSLTRPTTGEASRGSTTAVDRGTTDEATQETTMIADLENTSGEAGPGSTTGVTSGTTTAAEVRRRSANRDRFPLRFDPWVEPRSRSQNFLFGSKRLG